MKKLLTGTAGALLIVTAAAMPALGHDDDHDDRTRHMMKSAHGYQMGPMYQSKADMQEAFQRADSDQSGGLSKAELKAFWEAEKARRQDRHHDALDSNDDGQISKDEFLQASGHRMSHRRHFMHRWFN
jgi:hypothetical protein